jgi:tripartite-type tricarboxylate transporter receptor subunit TctC
MRLHATVLRLSFCAALVAAQSGARADEPFYKGKRITMVINFAVGGPADVEGRLFVRHLGKHIEGNPTILVQNMDGAGGLIGANYLGEVAARDGTVLGHLTGTSWRYANDPERFRVDLKAYEFIAYQPSTSVYFMRTDVPPGVKVATDIGKVRSIVSGGLGPDNGKDLLIRLGLEMLGIANKHITSYRSSPQARLALQQGEIQFFSESPPSYRSIVHPGIVKEGLAIPVWYDSDRGGREGAARQVEGLGIMPYDELHKAIKGALPSGELWDVYRAISTVNGSMLRLLALPPGAPPAAVEALRTAVAQLANDKAYAQDAMKTIGFVPDYETGPDTNAQVLQGIAVRPEIRAFIADYVKKGSR